MTGDEYLIMVDRKYAFLDRECNRGASGRSALNYQYDQIQVSGRTGIGKKFKNTLKATQKFFSGIRISYGINSRKKVKKIL